MTAATRMRPPLACKDDERPGLEIGPVDAETFRHFARRFGDSPEIGPIGTCLDHDARPNPDAEHTVVGLFGCGKLCAVACVSLFPSKTGEETRVLKLDSVIVDPTLRRRGIGALLVAQTFRDLVGDSGHRISRIYAHSVHPATVRMLRRLAFDEPQPTGAPISHVGIEGEAGAQFLRTCEEQIRTQLSQKRLQCAFCRTGSRRSVPWCVTRDA